jgi:hypothetical protein
MMPRWFRFHLSTAILLMVAAGGLIGLNVIGKPNVKLSGNDEGHRASMDEEIEFQYGFPFVAYSARYISLGMSGSDEFLIQFAADGGGRALFIKGKGLFAPYIDNSPGFQLSGIAIDVIFAIMILGVVGFVLEYFISRKR